MILSAVMSAAGMMQSSAQANAQAKQAAAQRDLQVRQLQARQQIEEKRKRNLLKQKRASQRAAFGAQGVMADGGSAQALMTGLTRQTEDEIADDQRMTGFGIEKAQLSAAGAQTQSLLRRSAAIQNGVLGIGKEIIKP